MYKSSNFSGLNFVKFVLICLFDIFYCCVDSEIVLDIFLFYLIDMFGIVVFVVFGVFLVGCLKMDLFGVMVFVSVIVIGGGIICDMVFGVILVFWIKDINYLWVIMIICVLIMLLVCCLKRFVWWILFVCDVIGFVVFVGIGVEKVLIY